jgi:hypothetical protein
MPLTNRFVNIKGLSVMLSADPEFADIVEQLSIDYSFMSVISPEKRLAMLMVKCGVKMNGLNNMKAGFLAQQSVLVAAAAREAGKPVDSSSAQKPVESAIKTEYKEAVDAIPDF